MTDPRQGHDAAPQDGVAVSTASSQLARSAVPAEVPPAPPGAVTVFGDRLPLAQHYAALLADTGVLHGLIGPREVPRLWDRHILNCAAAETAIPEDARVVDIGSGAGLPGLCLALARPDLDMHLVEPMARRTAWLEVAVSELGLDNVTVHRGRADEVDVLGDVVTARAVSRLSTLAGWMASVARPSARMVALKGASAEDELARDRQAAQRAGWTDLGVRRVDCPGTEMPTTLILGTFIGPRGKGKTRRRA